MTVQRRNAELVALLTTDFVRRNEATPDTSAFAFLLDGIDATVQAALVRLDTRGMMEKLSVDAGDSLTIPTGWQLLVHGPYTVDGDLTVDGKLVIL